MKSIFVTGTDTNVGKTLVTGLLGRFFYNKKYGVVTQKWVETGSVHSSNDIATHLALMDAKKKTFEKYSKCLCPYIFKYPASPHLASKIDGRKISIIKIKKCFQTLKHNFNIVIVEGVGGILVPLTSEKLVIDVVSDLKIPTVIVVSNKLGAINHTLLTVGAIKERKIPVIGLVFNNYKTSNQAIARDNIKIIQKLTGETVLGIIPRIGNRANINKVIAPIGAKILQKLKKYE